MLTALFIAGFLGRVPALVDVVYREAVQQQVDPILAIALVEKESNFQPWAFNRNWDRARKRVLSTDVGLFQLNSGYWPQFADDLHLHCYVGTLFLWWCLREYDGDVRRALSHYNTGGWTMMGRAFAEDVLRIYRFIREAKID